MTPEQTAACQMVPCERCGAEQGGSCPGVEPCGVRRLLAVERGHLDPDTSCRVTRGRQLSGARS